MNHWRSRISLYFIIVGSACGLGNLWRFPFVVAENGGGAFVLLYVLMAFLVGLSFQIGELVLGRMTQASSVPALTQMIESGALGSNKIRFFKKLAYLPIFVTLITLAYYSVVSGWVLHFLNHFVVDLVSLEESREAAGHPEAFMQVALSSVHMLFVLLVVGRGMQQGVQKWSGPLFIVLVVLLGILFVRVLQLPTLERALRFLFYPDFSQLNADSLGRAIGHVFFTLSVGFGMMITFGKYIPEKEDLPQFAFRLTLVDTLLSIFSAVLIFPIALLMENESLASSKLLFIAFPPFFHEMRGGLFLGLAFFLALYLTAFGASVGLLETAVSAFVQQFGWSRRLSSWALGLGVLVLGMVPALRGWTHFVDSILVFWLLPTSALLIVLAVAWLAPLKKLKLEFDDPEEPRAESFFGLWLRVVRWLAPLLILSGWGLSLFF